MTKLVIALVGSFVLLANILAIAESPRRSFFYESTADTSFPREGASAPARAALYEVNGLVYDQLGLAAVSETAVIADRLHQTQPLFTAESQVESDRASDSSRSLPEPKTPAWQRLTGPYGGYVSGLTMSPFSNAIMLAGCQGGGLYQTTDSGAHWQDSRAGLTADWPHQIAFDPTQSAFVYCAANNYWFSPYGNGNIFKSTDSGWSWTPIGPSTNSWLAVLVSSVSSSIVLAGGADGIYRSTNAGATWASTGITGTVVELSGDPSTPTNCYAGTYGYRLLRTTDSGLTWKGLGASIANGNIRSVAVDPTDSNIVYAAAYDQLSGGTEGIYKSTDLGDSWTHCLTANTWRVRVDHSNPARVWAVADGPPFTGTPAVYKSTDYGATWASIPMPTSYCHAPLAYQLAINPINGNHVYVGLFRGGILKTTDGGGSWVHAHAGLDADYVNDIAVSSSDPATLYAGTVNVGLWKTTDNGISWFTASAGFTDTAKQVNAIALFPATPSNLLIGASSSGVWRSTDSGGSWAQTGLASTAEIRDIQIAPSDSTTV